MVAAVLPCNNKRLAPLTLAARDVTVTLSLPSALGVMLISFIKANWVEACQDFRKMKRTYLKHNNLIPLVPNC